MRIFDFYLFRHLLIASVFIALSLVAVIFLTQSLRFLELVIESGASGFAFWVLTLLALPRFFEVIVPLSVMSAVLFIYNRMTMDSELIVARASGISPFAMARPAIMLGLCMTVFVASMTLWLAPLSLNQMQKMQNAIKAQFSTLIFREQVFNSAASGLTLYVRERGSDGILYGLMIHDTRVPDQPASTIVAQRGAVSVNEEGFQITVYDGSRQQYDRLANNLQTLDFDRYTIDLPDSNNVQDRWREPDERSIVELFYPDENDARNVQNLRNFQIEIHKRVTAPFLALAYALIAACALILGTIDRRGLSKRIIAAILICIAIQAVYLSAFNLAVQSNIGFILLYVMPLLPIGACLFILSKRGEVFRGRLFRTNSSSQKQAQS